MQCVEATKRYSLSLEKSLTPTISILNPKGKGYTPCNYTFNPAWIEPSKGTNGEAGVLVRAAECPADFGGVTDHILMAKCNAIDGTCSDVLPMKFPFEDAAGKHHTIPHHHTTTLPQHTTTSPRPP